MKTIGLLGGMSWESSIEYERILNEEVRRRLGGTHSADLIIRSYDFATIERLQESGGWDAAGDLLAADAVRLQEMGAQLVLLCTNTMHKVADRIEAALAVPFLDLVDIAAGAVLEAGVDRVGLLGTRYTMEDDFYRSRLQRHGIAVDVPEVDERTMVDRVIFGELVRGVISAESRDAFLAVIDRLVTGGAGGIVAGCTEIELLVDGADIPVPYFPTTRLHAIAAVDLALGGGASGTAGHE